MALAPFFEKNVVAAAQLLRGYDKDSFARALTDRGAEVVFDGSVPASSMGRLLTELLVNLLARLYPVIHLTSLDDSARAYEPQLIRLARSINPAIEFGSPSRESLRLVVGGGKGPEDRQDRTLFVGGTGWTGVLSRKGPVPTAEMANPFGAGMAACLAAANAFRHTFREQLDGAELDEDVAISCAGLIPGRKAPSSSEFHIGTTQLVGAGAVGQGVLWAFRNLAVHGVLEVIDPEDLELSNVQRYVLTHVQDVGKPKIGFAEAKAGLEVRRHRCSWGEFVDRAGCRELDCVLVAVDSAEARCAVQAALPKRILNAWTQPLNLGVSRHSFDGDAACLMCLYLPKRDSKNRDERIREALRLPPEATMEVRRLLARNEPLSPEFVGRVAAASGAEADLLKRFIGRTLAQLYSEAVCGGTLLRVPTGQDVQTPMAFQSALAGILMAADLVLNATGTQRAPTRTTLNVLRPVGVQETSFMDAKHESGNCICQDSDYVETYKRKYAAAA